MAKRTKNTFTLGKTAGFSPALDAQAIYCGDNIDKLSELPGNFVDLCYIDPPFNSNRNYEVFWPEASETRRFEDRHESTRAYIEFMRPRCLEIRRILKETGSFYYHCDWHASHYVKVMLDGIFGENNFQSEVVWKRSTTVKDNAGQGGKHWAPNVDSLFFYTKSQNYTFNQQYYDYSEEYLKKYYKYVDLNTNRRYRLISMIGPGGAAKGNPCYEVMGVTRHWRYSRQRMAELIAEDMVVQPSPGAVPVRKQYLDIGKGVAIQTLWEDIEALGSTSKERLGYPTQKPVALLERIIKASSNPGDIVLDAFCGCGTALVASQHLERRWIGIDISPTACRVMADRLERDCGMSRNRDFTLIDMPHTEQFLRRIPYFEFENWAVLRLGGIPNASKVGDMGIDGRIYPASYSPDRLKDGLNFMDHWFPVQVKQRDKAGRPDIDAFEAVMMREDRTKGFFVSFDFTRDAESEVRAFFRRTGKEIVPVTVAQILANEIPIGLR